MTFKVTTPKGHLTVNAIFLYILIEFI